MFLCSAKRGRIVVSKKYVFLSNVTLLLFVLVLIMLRDAAAQEGDGFNPELAPVSSAFTYQGQLETGGVPVNNTCDMTFSLYNALAGGSQVGSTQTVTNITVTDGVFTAALNGSGQFGATAFAGDARWLQIAVRCPAGAGGYTTLSPRQETTATPYSIYSLNTGALRGIPISTATPAAESVLQYNGSQWAPSAVKVRRLFYLTTSTVAGNAAITACAAGYHMASMWEIFDVSTLEYNTSLGYTATDSGSGPPASIAGWIRTGVPSFTNTVPGNANCNAWSSNNAAHNGTRVNLQPQWASASEFTAPWDSTVQACGTTSRVWCVEN